MDNLIGPALPQPAPVTAPTPLPLAGPAQAAAPIEPSRRVTANRDGGRADLAPQQQAQRGQGVARGRGRLIDLFV
jgi:hypothetical protein